jgi:hypothetical protein
MERSFYSRLKLYYQKVGTVLRGEAEVASIFPNPTDKGITRENVYAEFLRSHLPTSCNVFFGGFVFGLNGDESKQIDLIITNDICPQYNFQNRDGQGKTFACIDGTLAVVSIKSNLDAKELRDCLDNLASLPQKTELGNRVMPLLNLPTYEDWPFKIIYASNGMSLESIMPELDLFYQEHDSLPINSHPNLIHVAGKYNIVRISKEGGRTRDGTIIPPNVFYPHSDPTDVFALVYAVQNIQKNSVASKHILFTYDAILENIPF